MANWTGVITNAGNNVLTEWVNEKTLMFNNAAAGQGTVAIAALLAQTTLVNQKQAASIIGVEKVSSGIRLKLRITAPQEEYTLNQYGVWASVTGGPSTMIALFQHENGIPIPSAAESPDFVFTFYALITTSNTGTWTVNIDTSIGVTAADMAEAMETKQDTITANGLLKGGGVGMVHAAVAGTDYSPPLLTGPGMPSQSTVGTVGQLYMSTNSSTLYICTSATSDEYTWSAIEGVGGIASGYCATEGSATLKYEGGFVNQEVTDGTVVGIYFVQANTAQNPALQVNGVQGPIFYKDLTPIVGVELTIGFHFFFYTKNYSSWIMLDSSTEEAPAIAAAIAEGLQ